MTQVLTADSGGGFTVEFDEPGGTGYQWEPMALPAEIRLEADEVIPSGPAEGSVRRRVMRIGASKAGRYRIDFELKRPWERKAVEARRVQVRVEA